MSRVTAIGSRYGAGAPTRPTRAGAPTRPPRGWRAYSTNEWRSPTLRPATHLSAARRGLPRTMTSRTPSRRTVLRTAGSIGVVGGAVLLTPAAHADLRRTAASAPLRTTPFTLGVASGDPAPDGFVLWTRLAPEPLAPDGKGGMPSRRYEVQWEVAADPGMRRVVKRGTVSAGPESAHAVHVEVAGLADAREYWYRFRAGTFVSPVGRTLTAPKPSARACLARDVVRLLLAVRARLLHGVPPSRRGPARPGAAPGRLPVRVQEGRLQRSPAATSATTRVRRR